LDSGFHAYGKVDFYGAQIDGDLICRTGGFCAAPGDPDGLSAELSCIKGAVYLDNFNVSGEVDFYGANIAGDFDCVAGTNRAVGAGQFVAMDLRRAVIKGSVFLTSFRALGDVDFSGANIAGVLDLGAADIQAFNTNAFALLLENIAVKERVVLNDNFHAYGGIDLYGAIIGGNLECDTASIQVGGTNQFAVFAEEAKIDGSAYLRFGFAATGQVDFLSAAIGGDLDFENGKIKTCQSNLEAILAERATINGDLFMRNGFAADGKVDFDNVAVGKSFDCNDGTFRNPGQTALSVSSATIKNKMNFGSGFRADGKVELENAVIGTDLYCRGGNFFNQSDDSVAIDAVGASIKGDVSFGWGDTNSSRVQGEVKLDGADVGGDVYFTGGYFTNQNATAISLYGAKIERSLELLGHISGSVDMRLAHAAILEDDPSNWPDGPDFVLNGFACDKFSNLNASNVSFRVEELDRRLQKVQQFYPEPYIQLANMLRSSGFEDESVQVLIDKNRRQAQSLKRFSLSWWWYGFFGKFINYGYRPLNALWASLAFVILGWVVFAIGYTRQCRIFDAFGLRLLSDSARGFNYYPHHSLLVPSAEGKGVPRFNALIFSFETFVPIIKLAMGDYWRIDASRGRLLPGDGRKWFTTGGLLRLYYWIHIVAGWVLTTLLVGALAGLIKT